MPYTQNLWISYVVVGLRLGQWRLDNEIQRSITLTSDLVCVLFRCSVQSSFASNLLVISALSVNVTLMRMMDGEDIASIDRFNLILERFRLR